MKAITNLTLAVLTLLAAGACNKHQIDNEKSNYNAIMEISASAPSVVLDEARPNEVALTVSWTPAFDYGSDFIMTYEYSMDVSASKASPISEYEDEGRFTRSYTHKELQDMLVGHFGQLTSTVVPLKFNVTASYSGPRIVIPDMSSVVVTVKTYGPKQFAADKVFMGGTAVGATPVELAPSPKNAALYVYNGNLAAGKLNFPVIYGEENNVIVPASGQDTAVTGEAQAATAKDASEAAYWLIPSSESYRVTLNFNTKTVTVIPSSQIFESDALYLAGSSLEEEVLLPPTVENSAVYAFHGALKAGTLYIPVEFEEARTLSIVPASDSHEITDGTAVSFGQALTSQTSLEHPLRRHLPGGGGYRRQDHRHLLTGDRPSEQGGELQQHRGRNQSFPAGGYRAVDVGRIQCHGQGSGPACGLPAPVHPQAESCQPVRVRLLRGRAAPQEWELQLQELRHRRHFRPSLAHFPGDQHPEQCVCLRLYGRSQAQ